MDVFDEASGHFPDVFVATKRTIFFLSEAVFVATEPGKSRHELFVTLTTRVLGPKPNETINTALSQHEN